MLNNKFHSNNNDSDVEIDYDVLNAAANRKNKKSGGWQAMGKFKKNYFKFKLLIFFKDLITMFLKHWKEKDLNNQHQFKGKLYQQY